MTSPKKPTVVQEFDRIDRAIDDSILSASAAELHEEIADEGGDAGKTITTIDAAIAAAKITAEKRPKNAEAKRKAVAATSTEITGGAGFTYEDAVVAYFLTALLREETAAGQTGTVTRVAVQQARHGEPLDDIIVDTTIDDEPRRLSLQVKRAVEISAAPSNEHFREIVRHALETRAKSDFRPRVDRYGFAVEHVAEAKFRGLNRLIDGAKSSPAGNDFEAIFAPNAGAGNAEKVLRDELKKLIAPSTVDQEADFYRHLVAFRLEGFEENGVLYADMVNRLSELFVTEGAQQAPAMFSVMRQIARNGAGTGRIWTRPTLLSELKDKFRLKAAPKYAHDLAVLGELAHRAVSDIAPDIDGLHIQRGSLSKNVLDRLKAHRFVNISGLPGSGKSVVLRSVIEEMLKDGPALVLKSDRLQGTDWLSFATSLGLQHKDARLLLAEVGSAGNPILFVDGIDRIKPTQRKIVTDILETIMADTALSQWKVLATSRDEGLEAFRSWIPTKFYGDQGVGDVAVSYLDDVEAEHLAQEKPALRDLLFGSPAIQEIARRPFFAAVLAAEFARSGMSGGTAPGSESELIAVWWRAGGHDAERDLALARQRALVDLAEVGASNLGKSIAMRDIKDTTQAQIATLCHDRILRWIEEGHTLSFTHDIYFEWAFFRLLIDMGTTWPRALSAAGEPPLLARIIALLSQHSIARTQNWAATYRELEAGSLRPQWRRAWLTGPASSPQFVNHLESFQNLLAEGDHELFEKFLVWFQAEHTIPNPLLLTNPQSYSDGASLVRMADLFGWPSDFRTWKRVIVWLLSLAPSLPARLVPNVLELFKVWQNAFGDIKNGVSNRLISVCNEWLTDLEKVSHRDKFSMDYGRWQDLADNTRSSLEEGLRFTILRSARSFPDAAVMIIDRALANERMRRRIYDELVGFAPILSGVAPEKLASLARAELINALPKDEIEEERQASKRHYAFLKWIRDKPEHERSEKEQRILSTPTFVGPNKTYNLDDFAIDEYHQSYFPPSPLHEPFGSLFKARPDLARALVRDLANHAMEAWRQVHEIDRAGLGTPIPLDLEFPWGRQRFWGDWRIFNWFKGQLAPQPLECALLALSYWAHKQLDAGIPVDDVIKDVVEGHECWAVLGIATSLALEAMHASETVLPLATCQRLWHVDLARMTQEHAYEADPLGLGLNKRLSGDRVAALDYLKARKSRFREVRNLVPMFALHSDDKLREKFKSSLAAFPSDLPYFYEEERSSEGRRQSLLESAQLWAGWGDAENYKMSDVEGRPGTKLVEYQAPAPLPDEVQDRLSKSALSLRDSGIMFWAKGSLETGALKPDLNMRDALAHVRSRETPNIFAALADAGRGSLQSSISAVAAVVVLFGNSNDDDLHWAWDVLSRVERMPEPEDYWPGSRNPWHPTLHLVAALRHDLRQASPRSDSAQRLLRIALHPQEDVSVSALAAALGLYDRNPVFAWVAAGLASDLFVRHATEVDDHGTRDSSANKAARDAALESALARYASRQILPLTVLPPAWVHAPHRSGYRGRGRETPVWRDPDASFDFQAAEKIIRAFPVEFWCGTSDFKDLFLSYLNQLTAWTSAKLAPEWRTESDQRHGPDKVNLSQWPMQLADLVARSAPFLSVDATTGSYLSPFEQTPDDSGLAVITDFAEMTVCRHIFDSDTISDNTITLLDRCLATLLSNRVFNPSGYRAGEIHGFELPRFIKALLFVSVGNAPEAKRFANGDWTELPRVMPLIDKLVRSAGWSPFVMETFLTLCERSGAAFPVDAFAEQTITALESLKKSSTSWIGLMHPARLAGIVQILADANYPLTAGQSRRLLIVLDALIDLGDRRSAALEQSEAFRNTQISSVVQTTQAV
jgi:hypothetical protein